MSLSMKESFPAIAYCYAFDDRIGRKQPLVASSGEWPVCPETSRSGGSISYLLSGCF
jgi:hypothetical protein